LNKINTFFFIQTELSLQSQKIWVSKSLLLLTYTGKLKTNKEIKNNKISWLYSLIKQDVNVLSMSLILGVIISLLSLATAIYSQKLIDVLLPSKNSFKIVSSLFLLLFLFFLNTFFGYIRSLFLLRQSRDFNIRIINFFYTSLLKLPKIFFDSRKIGDMVARMNDTSRIQRTISNITSNIILDVLLIIISSIAIFSYNRTLGLITLIWMPIYTFVVLYFNPKFIRNQKKVMQSYSINESNYIDTIQGIETIKTNNRETFYTNSTKSIYKSFQSSIFLLGKLGLFYNILNLSISNLFITGVIGFSIFLVLEGDITSGVIIAILQLVGVLMNSTSGLAKANIEVQEAKIAFNRMFEFASIDQENKGEIIITNFESLDIKNMSFRFAGRKELLKNININIKKGEFVAIVGESGSGKSTLGQVLQQFYQFEKGLIVVNNKVELSDISTPHWRNLVGVIPQDIHIFTGNVIDNILLGKEDEPENIVNFCKKFGFEPFITDLPQGYSTLLGEEGINLSGGQKQIIALARVLYKKPQFLILDEATSAMDRNTEKFTLNLLSNLKQDIAVLFISHRLHTLKNNADKIFVLENGVISSSGNHNELLKTDNFYSEFWSEFT
jgi:ATP-binding cassette subfamily B protein